MPEAVDDPKSKRTKRSPALGELAALAGYVPQYEAASVLILEHLRRETLEWISLADLDGGRLDDLQLGTLRQVDAYQVKWSQLGVGHVSWSTLKGWIADLLRDRIQLATQHEPHRVLAHLYTDQTPSSSTSGEKSSPADFYRRVLDPLSRGDEVALAALNKPLKLLAEELREAAGFGSLETLAVELASCRFHISMPRPLNAELGVDDDTPESSHYVRDLVDIVQALLRRVTDRSRPTRLARHDLLRELGPSWQNRLDLAVTNLFPRPEHYVRVEGTSSELRTALSTCTGGYITLIGAPGTGKSTLLTEELSATPGVAANYYAFVPHRPDVGSLRSQPLYFLHDLVLSLERYTSVRGRSAPSWDVPLLALRFNQQLAELGRKFDETNEKSIILIDGLDHAVRDRPGFASFLEFLPDPAALPNGVVIVLGSQTTSILRPEIRHHLAEPTRTCHMHPLPLEAVSEIESRWGMNLASGDLYAASSGNPLVLTYLLNRLSDLEPEERGGVLMNTASFEGDIEDYYARIWAQLSDNEISFLALASRVRGSVDLRWLQGGSTDDLLKEARLWDQTRHLFRAEGERLFFFHDSFRLFCQRMSVTIGDEMRPDLDRAFYRQLATACEEAGGPQEWDSVYYYVQAGDADAVQRVVSPIHFRAQARALRPSAVIESDLRLAGSLLGEIDSNSFLLRLALAAREVTQRGYHKPARPAYLSLLLRLGHVSAAIDHVTHEIEEYGQEDDRQDKLRFSLELSDANFPVLARELLQKNEPFDLISQGLDEVDERHVRSPSPLLAAWSRSFSALHGAERLISRLSPSLNAARQESLGDQGLHYLAGLLASAADEMFTRGRIDEGDFIVSQLDSFAPLCGEIVAVRFRQARRSATATPDLCEQLECLKDEPELTAQERVRLAYIFSVAGREDAVEWLGEQDKTDTYYPTFTQGFWDAQEDHYLRELVLSRHDPARNVWVTLQELTPLRRCVSRVADLEGKVARGIAIRPDHFVSQVASIFQPLDREARTPSARLRLGQSPPELIVKCVEIAYELGRHHLLAVWRWLQQRWSDSDRHLLVEGQVVLRAVLGIPRTILPAEKIALLRAYVRSARAASGFAADDAVTIAHLYIDAGLADEARSTLQEAIDLSVTIYYRKDYHAAPWVRRMAPNFEVEETRASLTADFCEGLVALKPETEAGQVEEIARALVGSIFPNDVGLAVRAARYLREFGAIDWPEYLEFLLRGTAPSLADTDLWWNFADSVMVPVHQGGETDWLSVGYRKAAESRSAAWADQNCQRLARSVAVQGQTLALGSFSSELAQMGVVHESLAARLAEMEKTQPPRASQRAEENATIESAGDLIQMLRSGHDAVSDEWDRRRLIGVFAPQMDGAQLEEAQALLAGSSRHSTLMTIAERALELDDFDLANTICAEIVANGETRSWIKQWDGGALLRAYKMQIDMGIANARKEAMTRLAHDIAEDPYLLSSIADEFSRFERLFGEAENSERAYWAEDYCRSLLLSSHSNVDQPFPRSRSDGRVAPADALLSAQIELIQLPSRLAVEIAQRGLARALSSGAVSAAQLSEQITSSGTVESELRLLSIFEAAIRLGWRGGEDVSHLASLAASDHLTVRLASRGILDSLGISIPPSPARALPSAYQLHVSRSISWDLSLEPVAEDELQKILLFSETRVSDLAELAGVDPGALIARVDSLARACAGEELVVDAPSRASEPLGWAYYKESIRCYEHAIGLVAAELTDAHLLPANLALRRSTGMAYDALLISREPEPRPAEVRPATIDGFRLDRREDWYNGSEEFATRVVREVSGWLVLAEDSEQVMGDDSVPVERVQQAIVDPAQPADRISDNGLLATLDMPSSRLLSLAGVPRAQPIIRNRSLSFRGPDRWLALDPDHGRSCGWESSDGFLWLDAHGTEMVKSLWFQAGSYYGPAPVGGGSSQVGWLLLCHPQALSTLVAELGYHPIVHWRITRDFLTFDGGDRSWTGVRAIEASL